MNAEQLAGILRAVLPAFLAYAAGKGWIPGDQVGPISAAIVTLAMAAWSGYSNTKVNQIAAAAKLPEVAKIIATPAIADAALKDNPKVVSK